MEETPHTRPGPSGDRLLELLAPVHGELRALARRIARSPDDGDDLFQEAAIRALRKIGDLRDDDRFRGWFTRILLSVHRSRSRRAFWRRFVSLDAAEPGLQPRVQPPAPGDSARAFRALATLPAVQREAVVLFDLEGRGVDEIAALQHVSVSAVKSRLSRGRDRLRRFYRRAELLESSATGPARAAVAGSAKGDLS